LFLGILENVCPIKYFIASFHLSGVLSSYLGNGSLTWVLVSSYDIPKNGKRFSLNVFLSEEANVYSNFVKKPLALVNISTSFFFIIFSYFNCFYNLDLKVPYTNSPSHLFPSTSV